MYKEKKAPDAPPVSLHEGEYVLRHRPTLGWTVDEAWILWHRSIYSMTVQPWVGRWSIQLSRPWRRIVISKQYCFVAPKSLLTVPYAMKCFTTERISYRRSYHKKAPVPMPVTLERTTKEVRLGHGANA